MKKVLKKTPINVGLLMSLFLIFELQASPVVIEFNENIIRGESIYFDFFKEDYITKSYYKISSSPICTTINFASSSADIFNISNYAYNNDYGHPHDFIFAEASASSSANFTVTTTGNYQLIFSGIMNGATPFSGKTSQELKYELKDLSMDSIIVTYDNYWEVVLQEDKNNDSVVIFNSFFLPLIKDHKYLLKIEGSIYNTNGYISENQSLCVNLEYVPEPKHNFIGIIGSIILLSVYNKRNRKTAKKI